MSLFGKNGAIQPLTNSRMLEPSVVKLLNSNIQCRDHQGHVDNFYLDACRFLYKEFSSWLEFLQIVGVYMTNLFQSISSAGHKKQNSGKNKKQNTRVTVIIPLHSLQVLQKFCLMLTGCQLSLYFKLLSDELPQFILRTTMNEYSCFHSLMSCVQLITNSYLIQ